MTPTQLTHAYLGYFFAGGMLFGLLGILLGVLSACLVYESEKRES